MIAGLASLEVERATAPRQYAYSRLPRSSRFRSGANRSAPGVAAAFFPWSWLIEAVDPQKDSSADSNAVVAEAARSLREWLKKHGIEAVWGPVTRPAYARAEIRDPDGNHIELRQWIG